MKLPSSVKRWAFYNFANHSYQVIYLTFLLPVFFAMFVLRQNSSLLAWGAANGISTVVGVIVATIIGRYSDRHSKLAAFKWSIFLSLLGMIAASFASAYFINFLYFIFIATNAVFIWSLSLSDSILPHLSDGKTVYEYGGFAWGFGYLGGIASLAIVLLLQHFTGNYSLWVFLSVPIFYLLFSMYSLSGLKDVPLNVAPPQARRPAMSKPQKGILFLGYWLISEAVTVIALFASLFLSEEMHFSTAQIGIALLLVQLVGFPATWYGGTLVKKFGSLRLLGVTILLWGGSLAVFLGFHSSITSLFAALILFALAYGNSQSFLRSQYSTLIDRSESGFQFGLYSMVSEAAVIIGPAAYGYASDKLHSQKLPLIGLFILMVIGFNLILNVMRKIKNADALKTAV